MYQKKRKPITIFLRILSLHFELHLNLNKFPEIKAILLFYIFGFLFFETRAGKLFSKISTEKSMNYIFFLAIEMKTQQLTKETRFPTFTHPSGSRNCRQTEKAADIVQTEMEHAL